MKFLIQISLLMALLAGCSNSDSSSNGKKSDGNNKVIPELGYNPSQRWPELGEYSYDISFNGCKAQKSFKNQADYCMGLQDSKLNDGCALPSREKIFASDCGEGFQSINIKATYWISGDDDRLNTRCSTGEPGVEYFPYQAQLCQFLKDESLHKNCHWDQRYEDFKEWNCQGDFSKEPDVVQPPAPTPTPPSPPRPAPTDPLDKIPVVQELRAEGIQVTVEWQSIQREYNYGENGGKTLNEIMNQFWLELESIKKDLIARKSQIKNLEVTSHTSYWPSSSKPILNLQYKLNSGEGAQFIPLWDRLIYLEKNLGVTYSGIYGMTFDNIPFEPMQEIILLFEKYYSDLLSIKGVIKEIQFDSYTRYSVYSSELKLAENQRESELEKYIKLLKPLAPVYQWAGSHSVEMSGDFDIEKDQVQIHETFQVLKKEIKNLDLMAQAQMLSEIEVRKSSNSTSLWLSPKKLLPQVGDATLLSRHLQSLGHQAAKSLELGKPIVNEAYNIDDTHIQSMSLLDVTWSQIKAKSNQIKEITINSHSTVYYSSLQELHIHPKSTKAELEKVLQGIK